MADVWRNKHPPTFTSTFTHLGRLGRIQDWQFRQVIDALQKLFERVGVPWLQEVDWDFWRDSAQTLPSHHPTIAQPSR